MSPLRIVYRYPLLGSPGGGVLHRNSSESAPGMKIRPVSIGSKPCTSWRKWVHEKTSTAFARVHEKYDEIRKSHRLPPENFERHQGNAGLTLPGDKGEHEYSRQDKEERKIGNEFVRCCSPGSRYTGAAAARWCHESPPVISNPFLWGGSALFENREEPCNHPSQNRGGR